MEQEVFNINDEELYALEYAIRINLGIYDYKKFIKIRGPIILGKYSSDSTYYRKINSGLESLRRKGIISRYYNEKEKYIINFQKIKNPLTIILDSIVYEFENF